MRAGKGSQPRYSRPQTGSSHNRHMLDIASGKWEQPSLKWSWLMKIKDFIQRGRELYACCPGPHDDSGLPTTRRVALDLSRFDPDTDIEELKGKLRRTICGSTDRRKMLLIPQTDRQMRQGRQR